MFIQDVSAVRKSNIFIGKVMEVTNNAYHMFDNTLIKYEQIILKNTDFTKPNNHFPVILANCVSSLSYIYYAFDQSFPPLHSAL